MGVHHTVRKTQCYGNKKFHKGTVGSLLSVVRYRRGIEKSVKIILETLHDIKKKKVKVTPHYIMYFKTLINKY